MKAPSRLQGLCEFICRDERGYSTGVQSLGAPLPNYEDMWIPPGAEIRWSVVEPHTRKCLMVIA